MQAKHFFSDVSLSSPINKYDKKDVLEGRVVQKKLHELVQDGLCVFRQ